MLALGALLHWPAQAKPQTGQIGFYNTITHEGSLRGYKVITPAWYDPEKKDKYPVLFLLHGDLCSPDQLALRMSTFTAKANAKKFILVLPQGMYDYNHNKLDETALRTRLFNDSEAMTKFLSWSLHDRDTVAQELRYLRALHAKVCDDYKVDRDQFYLAGHSRGALLTQYAAMELNSEFAAFASIASPVPDSGNTVVDLNTWKPGFRVPILLMNATKDTQVPYSPIFWRNDIIFNAFKWSNVNSKNAKDMTWVESTINTSTADNTTVSKLKFYNGNVDFYIIVGGGHHWHRPDGVAYTDTEFTEKISMAFGVRTYFGPSPVPPETLSSDINTTDIVWDFFTNRSKKDNGVIPKKEIK